MKKRITGLMILVILFMAVITGCSKGDDVTVEADGEKVVVFGSTGYFCNEGWDPAVGWDGWYIGSYGVCETLFRLDDSYTANNWLVESVENPDDLTWVLTLRDDVTFHNGAKMTADSVKKCFERTIEVNERAVEAILIDSIEADGQVLTIKTTQATPTLPNDLCDPLWVIYDAEGSSDFSEMTYFTGPFMPIEFEANVELTVVKYDGYWGEEPQIDKAVFKTVSDTDSLAMAVQNGEVDIAVPMAAASLPLFSESPYVIDSVTSTRGQFFRFNLESPAVADVAVRNAISMCIDRDGYATTICNDTTQASYGIYPEQLSFGSTEGLDLTVSTFDPEGAKQLLADAGYTDSNGNGILDKDGVELSVSLIIMSTYEDLLRMCEVLQSQLSEIGIELKVNAMENITDVRSTGEYDISCESYGMAPTGNPQYFIDLMFTSEGSNNFGHYTNTDIDALAQELSTTYADVDRIEIVKQIEQEVLDDAAFIFFAHQKFTCVYNGDVVAAYQSQPSEYYILDSNVTLK